MEPGSAAPKLPNDSAYKRNAVPSRAAGTPACATVVPPVLNENTATPDGVPVPAAGMTCTEPTRTSPLPAVANRCADRAGIEYEKGVSCRPSIETTAG